MYIDVKIKSFIEIGCLSLSSKDAITKIQRKFMLPRDEAEKIYRTWRKHYMKFGYKEVIAKDIEDTMSQEEMFATIKSQNSNILNIETILKAFELKRTKTFTIETILRLLNVENLTDRYLRKLFYDARKCGIIGV